MLNLYGKSLENRLLLGTAAYPSPEILRDAFHSSQACVATVSLRREASHGNKLTSTNNNNSQPFWQLIQQLNVDVLPNTAGCHSVKEAMTTAHMAREVFQTNWIKLEIIGHNDTLQPNVFALVEAAKLLTEDGFAVFPYTTDDLVVAEKLIEAGCEVVMPWGSPIGSGQGLANISALKAMRFHFPDTTLIIDAGIGLPSHASQAMELGFDGILLNSAVAKAGSPALMAEAFSNAIKAGRMAYEADPMAVTDMAIPSTPVIGKAFLS